MSVAHLETRELATFVAIASARCKAGTLGELAEMAAMMSRSNSAAYAGEYGDVAEPSSADAIEAEALRLLENDDLLAHFAGIVYNCVTNAGLVYFGDLPADRSRAEVEIELARWDKIEDEAKKWQDGKRRELQRAEENAVAFNEVGRLPMKSKEELKALMGEGALIVAHFRVNESDSMTDYYGGRTSRSVVIGVRKGKRESFPSLRKAAAAFPPTADYGPGKSRWRVCANQKPGEPQHHGAYWHSPKDDRGHTLEFTTKAEAEAYITKTIENSPECQEGYTGVIGFPAFAKAYGVEYIEESIEHRENWSMGGGNYLGHGRYGGWVVKSNSWAPSEAMEVWKL